MSFQGIHSADHSTIANPALERVFLRTVFAWMFVGLGVTAGIAAWFSADRQVMDGLQQSPGWILGAFLLQLGLVMFLAFAINRISAATATFLFILYAAVTGVVFAVIIDGYTAGSVGIAFAGATGVFAGMALWGFATKRDLTGLGPILFGALIGLIIASVVFAFVGGSTFNLILGAAGVFIFAGLTAFNVQQIKKWGATATDEESARKMAIFGALQLYLDFINLFLSLLRIFGSAR
jgi:FtsH-binding integral membrane protein